ncbi:MAG: polysaccharide biosynthesis C-terminal domain-containing protein [Melioribacteraceae bacterium]|nr:polysaccharide biosynthesis C-terminal domain-containing protein [Melioribacteraceae bacterium]
MRDKLKELTKDTAIYGISTIVGRLFGFILIPFLSQFLSKSQMGVYGNIYSYIAFLNIIYIYGMDAAFLKYTSVAEEKEKKAVFSTPFIFVFVTSLIFSVLFTLNVDSIGVWIKTPPHYTFLLNYVGVILFFDTLALIPFAHLRLQRKAKKFAVIKIVNITINLTMNIVLIGFFNYDIDAIFISNAAASIITFIILIPDIYEFLSPKIDKALLKKMLYFGLPYLPAALSATVVQVIDRPLLTYLTDDATVGVYTTNYKLGISMMLYVGMFQYAWQPFFLNNAKEKNAKEIFSKVLTAFVLVGSVIVVILTLFINDIVAIPLSESRTLIDAKFWDGLVIVPVILFAYLLHGMYINFQAGIYIEEKTKYFPLITGAGAVVNILVNLWLIPILGLMGAALATLASYLLMALLLFNVVQKFFYIKYEYKKILLTLMLTSLVIIGFYLLFYNNSADLIYRLLILLGFSVLIFTLKIINKDELAIIFKMLKLRK